MSLSERVGGGRRRDRVAMSLHWSTVEGWSSLVQCGVGEFRRASGLHVEVSLQHKWMPVTWFCCVSASASSVPLSLAPLLSVSCLSVPSSLPPSPSPCAFSLAPALALSLWRSLSLSLSVSVLFCLSHNLRTYVVVRLWQARASDAAADTLRSREPRHGSIGHGGALQLLESSVQEPHCDGEPQNRW